MSANSEPYRARGKTKTEVNNSDTDEKRTERQEKIGRAINLGGHFDTQLCGGLTP